MQASHMTENLDIFGFELTDAEMTTLSALPQKKCVGPLASG
jgi:diketogulonate reductase-like aldo/keto reductase